jgi:hypothetical protein
MTTPLLLVDAWMRQAGVVHHPVRQPVQVWPEGMPPLREAPLLPVCTTRLPADFCTCGAYVLLEDTDA